MARAIIDLLPDEDIVYIGDTANGPYGPLTIPEIRRHALAIGDDLAERIAHEREARGAYALTPTSPLLTSDEEALLERLPETTPQDALIAGIARGGLIPATLLAQHLGVRRVSSLGLYSYADGECGEQGELQAYGAVPADVALIVDDIIDIASESGETGKTPGTDLREGKRTLPVLNALASTDPADAELQELLRSELKDDDERLERTLELLRVHPGMAAAREETLEVGRRATASLDVLPDSDAKTALIALMDGVIHRVG